ncbi:MAG: crossover junction endodeoxyribonuclease RuvC [Thermoanaerobaculia bacterium]
MPKVLGVDPGSRVVGLALLKIEKNNIKYLSSHLLKFNKGKFPSKLSFLLKQIESFIREKKPDVLVMEDNFYHKNPKVLLLLGRISGVIIAVAASLQIPVILYSPTEIKKSITGSGQASKEQVSYMVKKILNLEGETLSDATDAIAIGMSYFYKNNFLEE